MSKATKLQTSPTRILPPEGQPFRLDLGCGDNKAAGHIGIDAAKTGAVDYVLDLTKSPWPIDDGVVDSIYCSHFFEHLTGPQRPAFMDECWRILKSGAQIAIITPHWSSMRSVQDFSHQWPPIAETSYLYFNKGWREANKLTHGAYTMKCDFDFGYGHALDGDIQARADSARQFATKHYMNAVLDLHVTLTKRG